MGTQGGAPDPGVDKELARLAADFPELHFWRGVAGLVYARRPLSSPPRVWRAVTAIDLREVLRGR